MIFKKKGIFATERSFGIFMNKRETILYSAMELITEHGFHGTSMSMIYKKAGVAVGTIYHHFESKNDLINQLHTELKSRFGMALINKDQSGLPVKERFFLIWKNIYAFFIQNPKEFMFLEQYANSPFIAEEVKAENQKFYQHALDYLHEGMKLGVLRSMNVNLMGNLIFSAVATTVKMELSGEIILNTEMLNQIIQSSWDGVKIT